MPVSAAQKKASAKYLENLDEVRIRMPKGKKATIQAHAASQGESVNSFINRAIDQAIAQEATGDPTNHVDASMVSLPSEASERAPAGRIEGAGEE